MSTVTAFSSSRLPNPDSSHSTSPTPHQRLPWKSLKLPVTTASEKKAAATRLRCHHDARRGAGHVERRSSEEETAPEACTSRRPLSFKQVEAKAKANRLNKWLLVFLSSLFLLKHDPETKWFVVGTAGNFLLSYTLKRILNQRRPLESLQSEPGMPSAHANLSFFGVVFGIQSMVHSLGLNIFTLAFSVLGLAVASYISWTRISYKYHTTSQVLVGAVVGILSSLLWFRAWEGFVFKVYTALPVVRYTINLGSIALSWMCVIYLVVKQLPAGAEPGF